YLEHEVNHYSSHCDTSIMNIGDISTCRGSIVGKGGWLFIFEGSNDYIGSYMKEPVEGLASQWKQLYEARSEGMKARCIKFAQVIIPNKASVLSDLLPEPFMGKDITVTLDYILQQNVNP